MSMSDNANALTCPYCHSRRNEPAPLSPRETQVLRTWLLRASKQQVARELFISTGTVNTHLDRTRDKYKACGRSAKTKSELLARALQDGIVTLDEL